MKISAPTILLINPPQTFYLGSQSFSKSFPLGLAYIAAVLDREGYPVTILDALMTDFEVHTLDGVTQYGMSWQNMRNAITVKRPQIVGITCPFTAQIENAVKVAEIVKDVDPHIMTIIGGPDVSVRAVDILQQTASIDIAVLGEGEYTMLELVTNYQQTSWSFDHINGIAYRKGQSVVVNPPRAWLSSLDELPLPAYHLFPMEAYLNPEDTWLYANRLGIARRELPLITSRGCPFNCIFCSIHLHMGKAWRAHSATYVLNHLQHVVQHYGVNHIHFEDDNFTFDQARTKQILDGIEQHGWNLTWDTPNGVRADTLTREILEQMRRVGCIGLAIGVESGDQTVLDTLVQKRLKLHDVIITAQDCQEIGIPLYAFFVFGFPGETLQHMRHTGAFAELLTKRYHVIPILLVATPLPGTRLYQRCLEQGYLVRPITPRTLSEGTQPSGQPLIQTPNFCPSDLISIIAKYHSRIMRWQRVQDWTRSWGDMAEFAAAILYQLIRCKDVCAYYVGHPLMKHLRCLTINLPFKGAKQE